MKRDQFKIGLLNCLSLRHIFTYLLVSLFFLAFLSTASLGFSDSENSRLNPDHKYYENSGSVVNDDTKSISYKIGVESYVITEPPAGSGNLNDVVFLKRTSMKSRKLYKPISSDNAEDKKSSASEYYMISKNDKELLDYARNDGSFKLDLAISPLEYDSKSMESKDGKLFYKSKVYGDSVKPKPSETYGFSSNKEIVIPSSSYSVDMLKNSLNKYKSYDHLKVNVYPTSHSIKTVIASRKIDKDNAKILKKESSFSYKLLNLFGSSSEKEVFLERGNTLDIRSSAFDRTSGGKIYVTQSWSNTPDNTFEGWSYSYIKKDGGFVKLQGISVSEYGLIDGDIDAALNKINVPKSEQEAFKSRIERHANKIKFNHWVGGLNRAQSWSSISSLIGIDDSLSEWRQTIDGVFHKMFLGSEYWSESICYMTSDLPNLDENSIYSYDSDGNLMQSATIVATRQKLDGPNTSEYLYKVIFYISNPDLSSSKNSLFNSGHSSKSSKGGLIARGSKSSGGKKAGLDRKEKEFWNVIKVNAKEIKNTRSKYSNSGSSEDLDFNVVLSGSSSKNLFDKPLSVKPGDVVKYTGKNLITSYSKNKYDKACIIFTDKKPRNAFQEEISEICTSIKDLSPKPTQLANIKSSKSKSKSSRGYSKTNPHVNNGNFER